MSEVSDNILERLGGASFVEATGAYAFIESPQSLAVLAPGAKQGYRAVSVHLRPDDTYERIFSRGRGDSITRTGIPANKLQETFTKVTGLRTYQER